MTMRAAEYRRFLPWLRAVLHMEPLYNRPEYYTRLVDLFRRGRTCID